MSEPSPQDEATVSPPAGRPRREGNDSLWKRARRTLGTNSLTFLQPQSRPTGKSSLNSFLPPQPFLSCFLVLESSILQNITSCSLSGLFNRAQERCERMEKAVSGQQIMLTFSNKAHLLLLLDLVRRRRAKEENKFAMHNGMYEHLMIPLLMF